MTVGERIRNEMKKRDISQNKLARAAGISQSGLSSILNGDVSPKEVTLQAIASALNMSISELMGDQFTDPVDEATQIREELRRNPDMRVLFSAASKATPEHLRATIALLKALEPEDDT